MNDKEKMLGAAGSISPKRHRRQSQLEIIKACLEARPNEPISVLYLTEITGSLAVHSRIADLRHQYRMVIKNERREVVVGNEIVTHSTYTFCPERQVGGAPEKREKAKRSLEDEELLALMKELQAIDDGDGDDEPG